MDNFYTKTKCDCCGSSLDSGRIMSMYSNECICMKCKSEGMKRSDYEDAIKKDSEEHVGKQKFRCCICCKESSGYGNNPFPVFKTGRCCDKFNIEVVIPKRLSAKDMLDAFSKDLEED